MVKLALRNCRKSSFVYWFQQCFSKSVSGHMKGYFEIMKEVYLHQLSYYNNLSQFLHTFFQLGDTKLSMRPYFQKTDFSCLPCVFQGLFLDSWRYFLKNQERFLFWTTWATKMSFSLVKCVMDEEIKALQFSRI